jgi:hypothetical protein
VDRIEDDESCDPDHRAASHPGASERRGPKRGSRCSPFSLQRFLQQNGPPLRMKMRLLCH